jgi:tetratricopeptide (TPR) repeat protein
MARLFALAIGTMALATSTNAMAQYSAFQCTQIINGLTEYQQARAFKQMIGLARTLASYCQGDLPLALEALAFGLNGDNQHEEALAVASRCLQMNNSDVLLFCFRDKAEALYGLGRVQEAKATLERALRQPAVTEWDVKTKENLREFLAEFNAPVDPAAYKHAPA